MHFNRQIEHNFCERKNPLFKSYTDQIVIGKSSLENDEYDVLVFCGRNIKKVTVPNSIKTIAPFSLYKCTDLHEFEISDDSKLQTIGSNAFSKCFHLQRIVFRIDSNVEVIDDEAFFKTKIECFTINSNLISIGNKAFSECTNLRRIDCSAVNSKLKTIGKSAFNKTSIECFCFPENLTEIGVYAFAYCTKLKIVEVNEKINIECINNETFYECKETLIMIPAKFACCKVECFSDDI